MLFRHSSVWIVKGIIIISDLHRWYTHNLFSKEEGDPDIQLNGTRNRYQYRGVRLGLYIPKLIITIIHKVLQSHKRLLQLTRLNW